MKQDNTLPRSSNKNSKIGGSLKKALGSHVILECYECNYGVINDVKKVEGIMIESALRSRATIIQPFFHRFEPQGVTGVIIIAESHFTVHTWPEYNYAAVDFFSCSDSINTNMAIDYILENFESKRHNKRIIERGREYKTK